MASESIAHSAFGLMGYWLKAHSGWRNNCEIVSRLQTKDIDLMHQGQFLTPDSQIQTCCFTHD